MEFGAIGIDLKALRVIRVGQGNISSDCCLYIVKCILMDNIPMSQSLFGFIGPCDLSVCTHQPDWLVEPAFHSVLPRCLYSTGPCPEIYGAAKHSVTVLM